MPRNGDRVMMTGRERVTDSKTSIFRRFR